MSVLDGLAGVGLGLAGAGAAISARDERERAERQLVLNEQEGARAVQERTIALEKDNSNQNVRQLKNAGLLNDGLDRIDRDRTVGKLEANDAVAREALLNVARTSGFIDPSVKDIRFVKGPNDEWVIQTSNEDGSFGVITLDGSSDPNSPVASFKSLDDFIDIANVAYNKSVVRQDEFDIAKQNTVTQALNQQFDVLKSQLEAQDVPADQQVAIQRGVASGVANIEDPQEQVAFVESVVNGDAPSAASETPAAETPAIEPEAESGSRLGRNRREVRDAQERLNNTRAERRRSQLPDEIAAAEADLAQVRADFAERGIEPRRSGTQGELEHPSIQQRKDKITGLKAELVELEPATFAMDTPEDQEAMNQVAEQTKGVPAAEVAEKVASGEVTVTPAQQQQVAVNLQRQGVETVSDLRNLKSDRDRAIAIASMISAFKGDEATQRALLGQITNVMETGTPSMSASDAATLSIQQQTADLRAAELRRALTNDFQKDVQAASDAGTKMLKEWGKIKDDGDGDSFEDAMRFLNTQAAPYLNEYQNAPDYVKSAYIRALNPVVSEILAAYASQEEGGLAETFLSIFRGDVSRENISKTDFDLSRVMGDFTNDDPPKLKGFWFVDSAGMKLDESVEAKVVQDQDQTLYDILVMAAVANRGRG